ncbi:MAG: DUF3341 domain-containing protein [Rhodothermales bacterium]|nr:DUF3341 domain-containing protein [Rhodothermales bacterium]
MKAIIRAIKATMGIYEPAHDGGYGLLAEFSNPATLVRAARAVRDAGYKHFDTHTPFPIHGMDGAMGLGNSKVGLLTLGGGLTGLAAGILLQWWTGAVDYPLNISGKPFFAYEPSIPVIFELTILFAALGAAAGMFLLNGLPRPYNPLFYSKRFAAATDDAFFLHIAASDRLFDRAGTSQFLEDAGALMVEWIEDTGEAEVDPEDVDETASDVAETEQSV